MPKQVAATAVRPARRVLLGLLAATLVIAAGLGILQPWRGTAGGLGPAGPATASPPGLPLSALQPRPAPAVGALVARIKKLAKAAAGTPSVVLLDPTTSQFLINRGDRPYLPASTMKLLTAVAVIEILGHDRRFVTAVRSPRPGVLILQGGGDPLLRDARMPGRASLAELADATVAQLKRAGVRKVTLGYDAGRFRGPGWHRHWTANYRYSVAEVSALLVNGGRDRAGKADPDPARTAARSFAARLTRAQIRVSAPRPMSTASGDAELAVVTSPTVAQLVEHLLRNSDNTAAETLARQAAISTGRGADFAIAAATVAEALRRLGLWRPGTVIDDTSGLSRENRVRPSTLAAAMRLVLVDDRFRVLVRGLPVAGVSGTLADRFDDHAERAGRGVVRAKTGSLRDVATLAGYLITADGAPLTFALMANKVARPFAARDWMDATTARWAACGC